MNMEELKKIIQAIVISNAGCPMTILQLDRDFKCHEGYNIPYEKYGFQQLDAMLRSMSDAVQTQGQGSSALVLPVITAKSKHIREMVIKHKKNGKKRHTEQSGCTVKKGKFAPSERPHAIARDNVVISTAKQHVQIRSSNKSNNVVDNSCFTMAELKKLIQAMVISKPGSPLTVAQLAIDFKHHEGTDIPYREYGFQQLDALLRSIPDVVKLDGQGSSALVYPVTSEKSKHINVMIKAQKNNGKKCYNRSAYSTRSTRHSSKQGSNYTIRNRCLQSYNVRNDRSSNKHGNGYIFYGANNNHSINSNYGTNRCDRNGNLRDTINVPGQSNAPNGYGTNGFDTNRYPENGYSVPNHSYSSNGNNPIWNPGNGYNAPDHFYVPFDCNANRNQQDGVNIPSRSNAPNGYGMNDCNTKRYPGNSYNVPNHCYASNGIDPNWNLGNGYNAPDHFYGPNGCNANRNQWDGYNVPGQSYAWNGSGTNGFDRDSGSSYNFTGHSYSSNGNNPNWNLGNGYNATDHGPNGCNANRNQRDGYNVPGQSYAPNDYAVNCTEMYAGNSCNIPGNSCAPNGNNPTWNSGEDLHVSGHSYASDSGNSNAPSRSGGTNDSYYAALLGLYREIMGSDVNFPNQVNYLPYNSSGVPALDAILKPMWDAAQVNLLSDGYDSHGSANNVLGKSYNLSSNAKPSNNNFFITVNLGC